MITKNSNKKYIILAILFLPVVFLAIGMSYAFFSTQEKGKEYVVYTGSLAVQYQGKTDTIHVDAAYPMKDSQGLESIPHEFTIKNTGTVEAKYQIRLELEEDIKNRIDIRYIKMSYRVNEEEYSEPVLLSDLGSSLTLTKNIILSPDQSDHYGIKLWIDFDAPNEIQGKVFSARIVVDSIQNIEEEYVVDTAPIIYLNQDASGNQDMRLHTNDIYQELGVNRIEDDKEMFSTNQVQISYEYNDGNQLTTVEEIDTSKNGIYYVIYRIKDKDNNVGQAVRVVAVGDDTSLKIYHDMDSVVNSFEPSSLREVVMCSHIDGNDRLYLDCRIHDTIEDALSFKTKGVIIMTSDIERNDFILIAKNKDIHLELNDKTITFTEQYAIRNTGTLHINEKSTTGSIIGVNRTVIVQGLTNIYHGSFINIQEKENDGQATFMVGPNGVLNIYGEQATFDDSGNYVSGTYIKGKNNSCINLTDGTVNIYGGTIEMTGVLAAIRSNYNRKVIINIYGGEIIGETHGIGLDPNCPSTTVINVYGGSVVANTGYTVNNNSPATINLYHGYYHSKNNITVRNVLGITNIYGGVIISDNNSAVFNHSTGIIDIHQKDHSLYIASYATVCHPAVKNNSSGIINIKGIEANQCTNNPNDTTVGLCIYATGDGNYDSDTSNIAVANTGNEETGGIVNINGGTIFGGYIGISNHFAGTINISDGKIGSGRCAVENMRTGIVNICQATISSMKYDIRDHTDTGYTQYSINVIFTSGNNIPITSGAAADIIPNYTGVCTDR